MGNSVPLTNGKIKARAPRSPGLPRRKRLPSGPGDSFPPEVGSRFVILSSSSAGNCALLETDEARILVDAGLSGRKTVGLLGELGLRPEDLDAVFLTHEHQDHAAGLRGLSRYPHLRFFANRDTARALQAKLSRRIQWQLFDTETAFLYKDLEIRPCGVPHDAHDPVAFFFTWGQDDLFSPRRSLAWVNDLGHVPQRLADRLGAVDTLVVEANHDEDLLENDPRRPWSLKQRIRSRHGHLSNAAALEALQSIERPRWRRLCLGHLSRDCNDPSRVEDLFAPFCASLSPAPALSVLPPTEQPAVLLEHSHALH